MQLFRRCTEDTRSFLAPRVICHFELASQNDQRSSRGGPEELCRVKVFSELLLALDPSCRLRIWFHSNPSAMPLLGSWPGGPIESLHPRGWCNKARGYWARWPFRKVPPWRRRANCADWRQEWKPLAKLLTAKGYPCCCRSLDTGPAAAAAGAVLADSNCEYSNFPCHWYCCCYCLLRLHLFLLHHHCLSWSLVARWQHLLSLLGEVASSFRWEREAQQMICPGSWWIFYRRRRRVYTATDRPVGSTARGRLKAQWKRERERERERERTFLSLDSGVWAQQQQQTEQNTHRTRRVYNSKREQERGGGMNSASESLQEREVKIDTLDVLNCVHKQLNWVWALFVWVSGSARVSFKSLDTIHANEEKFDVDASKCHQVSLFIWWNVFSFEKAFISTKKQQYIYNI